MAVKKSEKPRVGRDGYYYFEYNVGAKYAVKTDTGIAIYEIIECIYRDEQQTYTVRVCSETLDTYREMSLARLRYIFATAQAMTEMNEGTPEELPVTKGEVELYYTRIVKARNKRRREVNAILKDDKDYQKLLDEEKALSPKWAQAIANESTDERTLEEQMQAIARKKREIMDKHNVLPAELKAPETCEKCNDKGITGKGDICLCAYKRSLEIKAFCSAERLVELRKEELLNVEIEDEEQSEDTQ